MTYRSSAILLFAALSLVITYSTVGAAPASFADDPQLADLPARWTELMDLFDVPGAAIVAIRDGEVYVETLGFRDPDVRAPVTMETMFYIASITKIYNAMAIGTLVAEERLSLDDAVKKHLPGLALPDSALTETLTVRDLLSHKYGLTSSPIPLLEAYTGEITDQRYAYWLARAEVAGHVDYSNLHFTLLGRLIEKVTGMDWRDYLEQSVLVPAGLQRTTGYASRLYADADSAVPTERAGDGWRACAQRKTDRTMHAAGGLGTTALDAARYLALHLADGEFDGKRIVSTAFTREMCLKQSSFEEPEGSIRVMGGFGLGWQVGTFAGEARLCSHGGDYSGAAAWFAILPDHDAGVAILINGGDMASGWRDIVAIDLLERLSGAEPPWRPYDRFPEMARQRKAKRAAATGRDGDTARLPLSALSRPSGLYTGWFHSPLLGTLIVESAPAGLTMRLGDASLEPVAAEAPDEFTLHGRFDPPPACRFIVSPGGGIEEILVHHPDLGEITFAR